MSFLFFNTFLPLNSIPNLIYFYLISEESTYVYLTLTLIVYREPNLYLNFQPNTREIRQRAFRRDAQHFNIEN